MISLSLVVSLVIKGTPNCPQVSPLIWCLCIGSLTLHFCPNQARLASGAAAAWWRGTCNENSSLTALEHYHDTAVWWHLSLVYSSPCSKMFMAQQHTSRWPVSPSRWGMHSSARTPPRWPPRLRSRGSPSTPPDPSAMVRSIKFHQLPLLWTTV